MILHKDYIKDTRVHQDYIYEETKVLIHEDYMKDTRNRLNTQQAKQDKREQDYVDITVHELCGSYTTRL